MVQTLADENVKLRDELEAIQNEESKISSGSERELIQQVHRLAADVKSQKAVNRTIADKFCRLEKQFDDEKKARIEAESKLLKYATPAPQQLETNGVGSVDDLIRM